MGIAERKEREKQQRREEIVQAAEKVFFSRGFEKSTMDDIAEQAELSKGTLYLYFKSKEDLHMAVAREAIKLLNSITGTANEVRGNALEKLVHMGRECIGFSNSHPDHMKAIMTLEGFELQSISYTVEEIQDMIYRESPVGMVIQIVEQGVREKLIRSDIPPPLIAHTLWMQVLSVIRFVMMKKSLFEMLELSPAQVYESHFELVLNGIRS
jgi:AcrR family transcriptional regulator